METFHYDNRIVRNFAIATVLWGIVGMLVGIWIAFQLPLPWLNYGEHFTFGRLRPIHTNAVIFAFVGNAIFMGVYHSLQRLCKARMFSDTLSKIHFWGWQAIIVAGAVTLLLGYTTSKEYAELEWPIDIAITVVWVAFGMNMMGTIFKRREKHMYVAIWFYIATFLAVAVLHVFNSLALPVSAMKSYSVYAGVQDALVQWWYGHNAVAFFLTTPYLGLMYYYLPKAAERPVYSYRLSIIHFWSLVFIYIWAGPHHLLYSAVPNWAQTLGVIFSIMLIAPSWGGMLNGLLTLRGAWDRVRTQPELKFMVVAVTAYGMVTFEGPLMSLKSVNGLTHFTDWVIAHVHNGALGWNGFLTFGILYWLIPRLYQTKLWSKKLANAHFWIGTLGIVFYVTAMYVSGLTQGLMWQDVSATGDLRYPNFVDTVTQVIPMYYLRGIGGVLYFIGVLMMVVNLIATAKSGDFLAEEEAQAPALSKAKSGYSEKAKLALGDKPVEKSDKELEEEQVEMKAGALAHSEENNPHRWLEGNSFFFFVFTAVAVLAGGLVELVPAVVGEIAAPTEALVKPYTPLELEGRDIYIANGCNTCHSQMIRPFYNEVKRYGDHSRAGDYVYEHPFLWGSKRTGPDLMRVALKNYGNDWHFNHMIDPQSTSPGSIMPSYEFMADKKLDSSYLEVKMGVLKKLGVPYTDKDIKNARKMLRYQADQIVAGLKAKGIDADWDSEMVAIIAYLQSLGKRIREPEEVRPATGSTTTSNK